jgi:phosphate transport system substrate-binding protein
MKKSLKALVAGAILAATAVSTSSPVFAGNTINGSGSTFIANMMYECTSYNTSSANTDGDTVSYANPGGGSGAGRTAFANKTVKFAAADSPYTSGAPANFVYVPLIAGSISVMYHLEGIKPAGAVVRLSPTTVGDIFAGKIKMWNDAKIVADNTAATKPAVTRGSKSGVTASIKKAGSKVTITVKSSAAALKTFKGKTISFTKTTSNLVTAKKGTPLALKATQTATFPYVKGDTWTVKVGTKSVAAIGVDPISLGITLTLPATAIRVQYRSGTSGTTNNFTNFLNKTASATWTKSANDSFTTAFPGTVPDDGSFQSQVGSDGVANGVVATNGAIGYTELSYALDRQTPNIGSAQLKNNAGIYVTPTARSTAAFYAEASVAADGLVTPDYTVQAADAYLLNAVAYGLGYTTSSADNTGVRKFFKYFLETCAPAKGPGIGYAPLAGAILTKALAQVAKIGPVS